MSGPLALSPLVVEHAPKLTHRELVEFYDARDALLGLGYQGKGPVVSRFQRFMQSRHPEAVHVCSLFSSVPHYETDMFDILSKHYEDPIALCYAGLCCKRVGRQRVFLLKAAEMGFVYAQGKAPLFAKTGEETKGWLERAALEGGDRYALYCWGIRLLYTGDTAKGNAYIRQAAWLGFDDAMTHLGELLYTPDDPNTFLWLGRAAQRHGQWSNFLSHSYLAFERYCSGKTDGRAMLMVGQVLHGHTHALQSYNSTLRAAEYVDLYLTALRRARKAIGCWLVCAKRLGPLGNGYAAVCKDMARMIGIHVWHTRHAFMRQPENHE